MLFNGAFLALCASVANAALQYRGVDWSSVIVEEKAGIKYKNEAGTVQPLEQILVAAGVNTVRQRVWVNPRDGNYNTAYNVALAKRAKAAGLGVYLDLHYSDTWADPGHQAIPSGWPTAVGDLAWKVYNYTLDVMNQMNSAGISPVMVSIGNEITPGMLFSTGSLSNANNLATILHSASAGIKDSNLATKPKIMVHLDNGWNSATQQNWYSKVLGAGPFLSSDYDIMGVSYYPFYNSAATLSSLKSSLANLASKWGKEIIVAETDWPTSCPSPAYAFPSDLKSIPFSTAGQTTFVQQVAAVVAGTPKGTGLFYWEPAWVDNSGLGSSCPYNTMFQYPGTALPSLQVFKTI